MARYVFIESRDPFESRDTQFVADTAAALKQRGHEVTVFLAQNGVLAARRNARSSYLKQLTEAGVSVLADDFSLRERGIAGAEAGVRSPRRWMSTTKSGIGEQSKIGSFDVEEFSILHYQFSIFCRRRFITSRAPCKKLRIENGELRMLLANHSRPSRA